MPEKRQFERTRRRVTCELVCEGRRFNGIALDLSPRGLFVKTNATADPGARVRATLRGPGGLIAEVEAVVARKRQVPSRLASVETGGVGLKLESASEAYYRLLEDNPGKTEAAPEVAPALEPELGSFRVRLQQSSGPRSRTLAVRAADEEEARAAALSSVGAGWTVLDVKPE